MPRDGSRGIGVSQWRYGRLRCRESLAAALREHEIVLVLVTCKVDRAQNSVVWGNVPIGRTSASGTRDFLATRRHAIVCTDK
jgi:hypothetical protein